MRTSFYQFIVMLFSTCTGYNSANDYTDIPPPPPIPPPTEEYMPEEEAEIEDNVYSYEEAIEETPSPQDIGYAYGVIIADQLQKPEMGLTKDEKNIDKIIEGFKVAVEGDSAKFIHSMNILKARFTSKQPSVSKEQAEDLAYQLGVNGLGLGGLIVEIDNFDKKSLDFQAMKKGYEDQMAGNSKIDIAESDKVLQVYIQPYQQEYKEKMMAKQQAAMAEQVAKDELVASENIEAGRQFLEKNAKRNGVITLESGLQYKVIKAGTGKKPTMDDYVKTHYHGTLIDGTVFDSSIDRGEPIIFSVGQVIKGWTEGLQLMKEGAKYRFYIPHDLAYGKQSRGAKLPAGSTLIFDVELIAVNPEN